MKAGTKSKTCNWQETIWSIEKGFRKIERDRRAAAIENGDFSSFGDLAGTAAGGRLSVRRMQIEVYRSIKVLTAPGQSSPVVVVHHDDGTKVTTALSQMPDGFLDKAKLNAHEWANSCMNEPIELVLDGSRSEQEMMCVQVVVAAIVDAGQLVAVTGKGTATVYLESPGLWALESSGSKAYATEKALTMMLCAAAGVPYAESEDATEPKASTADMDDQLVERGLQAIRDAWGGTIPADLDTTQGRTAIVVAMKAALGPAAPGGGDDVVGWLNSRFVYRLKGDEWRKLSLDARHLLIDLANLADSACRVCLAKRIDFADWTWAERQQTCHVLGVKYADIEIPLKELLEVGIVRKVGPRSDTVVIPALEYGRSESSPCTTA